MRMLHLYELDWKESSHMTGHKVLAKTCQAYSNAGIRNLYNYLRANGNRPYMTELPNGDIRIQYFNKKGE